MLTILNYKPFDYEQGGLLISISGIDGSGKSTLLSKLHKHFTNEGLNTLRTTQPSSKYREFPSVKGYQSTGVTDVSFESLALLSAFDRFCHVSELREELKLRDIILTDRYLLDGVVSFVSRGIDRKWFESINSFCPPPHIGILVDCPGAVSYARIVKRGLAMNS